MELNFDRIIRLKKIRIKKSELSEEENAISTPILSDKSLIYEIYKDSLRYSTKEIVPHASKMSPKRKKFIFIILYLFSPSTLAGGKTVYGIRGEIAKVVGIQSESTISNNCEDVVFLYQNYGDFSEDIDYLYTEIINRLKFRGLIN